MLTTLLALATFAAGSAPAFFGHTSAIASEEPEALTRAWVINAEMNPRDRLLPRKHSVTGARAYDFPGRLNDVARVYSLGVGEIRCPTQVEWDAYYGSAFAWGSTNLREDYATLAPFICEGALTVGDSSTPLWQQAAGVWVLVHESFHLRHWRFRRNEAKVACQAIVYFRDAAMRLGASEQQAEELYPYALALHIRQVELFSWYRDKSCQAPLWVPPAAPWRAWDGKEHRPPRCSRLGQSPLASSHGGWDSEGGRRGAAGAAVGLSPRQPRRSTIRTGRPRGRRANRMDDGTGDAQRVLGTLST